MQSIYPISSLLVLHSFLATVRSFDDFYGPQNSFASQAIQPMIPFTEMHPIDVCLFACNLCYDVVSI